MTTQSLARQGPVLMSHRSRRHLIIKILEKRIVLPLASAKRSGFTHSTQISVLFGEFSRMMFSPSLAY